MSISYEKAKNVFVRGFYRKCGKAIHDYSLISDGDKILVGVSGGKDSLALLNVLASRAKSSKEHYDIVAAHIAVKNVSYSVDEAYISDMCINLGVKFISKVVDMPSDDGSGKPACFICSWNRRKTLFELAKETGCNKLALGHHRDDAVESLLMSMMFNGVIASMPPKLSMFDGTFTLIRPLIYLSNAETSRFAEYMSFKQQIKACPHENITNRKFVSDIIKNMEKLNPDVRSSIFASMKSIKTEYLP